MVTFLKKNQRYLLNHLSGLLFWQNCCNYGPALGMNRMFIYWNSESVLWAVPKALWPKLSGLSAELQTRLLVNHTVVFHSCHSHEWKKIGAMAQMQKLVWAKRRESKATSFMKALLEGWRAKVNHYHTLSINKMGSEVKGETWVKIEKPWGKISLKTFVMKCHWILGV